MKSVLVYTVHKAASMFLHRLTAEVAGELDITYYSINYERDSEAIRKLSWKGFLESGNRTGCFGPIRAGAAEPTVPEDLQAYRIILHLRDPRDVLTSLFFSHVYSHARGQFNPTDDQRTRWEEQGIDRFVLEKAPRTLQNYGGLCSRLLGQPNVVLLKYEEMVSRYHKWLEQYLSAFSHFEPRSRRLLDMGSSSMLPRLQKRLYKRHRDEFIPPLEDINEHKRQITSGDHRRKLSARTIEALNEMFGDLLEVLEYEVREPVEGPPKKPQAAASAD
jgi:hypothetical protein